MTDLLDSLQRRTALAGTDRGDELGIIQRQKPELPFVQVVPPQEGVDLSDETGHARFVGDISQTVKNGPGIFRESRYGRVPCDISHMGEIGAIREAIEREMKRKGFSRRSLSSAASLSESAVRDLLTRTDNPGIGTLRKVAEALEMPVDALTGAGLQVPVLGKIGAGGEVLFALDPDTELNGVDEFPMVPRPPLVAGRLMALEVTGSSMLPKYEAGEIIYVRAPSNSGEVPDAALGSYCAIRTTDGGTYLKVLARGTEPERFTLRSLNAPDMENVEVVWASPVLFVMPRQRPA